MNRSEAECVPVVFLAELYSLIERNGSPGKLHRGWTLLFAGSV